MGVPRHRRPVLLLVRSPSALAAVIEAAGPAAFAQAGRILARRWGAGR